jgi:NAD(P)-dependent dehydrogenase (short-subunit alcohol dehydrogenase family)
MPTTHSQYGLETDAETVATAFGDHVKGKIIVVTGVNAKGIGGATVAALATQSPKLIIATGRSLDKLEEAIQPVRGAHPEVEYRAVQLDLSSQASCRQAAKKIADTVPHIDILINNAGVMNLPERQLSPEGIEMQFATNHIGHFLFTNLLMPKLLDAAKGARKGAVRIVNVSSRGVVYSPVRFSDYNHEKDSRTLPQDEQPDYDAVMAIHGAVKPSYTPIVAYGQSKTSNVLFSVGISRRLYESHGILSIGLHPGAILTELARYADKEATEAAFSRAKAAGYKFKSLSQGASTQLVAALDPALTPNEIYLSDCQTTDWVPKWATDLALADRLWELSEKLVGEKFEY